MIARKPTVWITGVRSGVGEALATEFLAGGWRVIGSSRARPSSRATWLRNDDASYVPMDVRSASSVTRAWSKIRRTAGSVDMLVNNAGTTVFKDVVRTSPAEFRDIIETNQQGLYHTAYTVLPSMRERRKGWIVNILSYAAKTVYTKSGAYAASKAGAEMLMRVVREENRDAGIRVVNVFPGAINTPMWSTAMRRDHGHTMMTPSDVAQAVYGLTGVTTSVVPEEIVLRPDIGDLTV